MLYFLSFDLFDVKINVIADDYITIHGCQSKKVKENQCVVDNSSSS